MRRVVEPSGSLPWTRLAIFAAVTVAAVSCSSESSRITDPFNSRNAPAPGEITGSVAAKSKNVQSRPLPPPQASAPSTQPVATGTAGGGRGSGGHDVTGSVASAPPQAARDNWNWEGGTPITVQPGENAHTLSQRHGVPAAVIAKANGLPDAAAIKPGQRLVIPRMAGVTGSVSNHAAANAPARPAPVVSAPATTGSTTAATGSPFVHVVAPGDTLSKLSRKYKKSVTEIARANNIPPHTMVKMGDRIAIPGLRAPVAAVSTQSQPAAKPRVATNTPPANTTARTITPAADNPAPAKSKADIAGAMPSFRWPVRGRVIAAYGSKPSGQQNDGNNVAVPEGTPIKASEEGVVVYAGNELKTYGNLVLVRHASGFVTAYAHASEILVKRDEAVKRGQTIAKAGQTGNVSTPQVHFEIRKGSSPVDPIPYLDKGGNT